MKGEKRETPRRNTVRRRSFFLPPLCFERARMGGSFFFFIYSFFFWKPAAAVEKNAQHGPCVGIQTVPTWIPSFVYSDGLSDIFGLQFKYPEYSASIFCAAGAVQWPVCPSVCSYLSFISFDLNQNEYSQNGWFLFRPPFHFFNEMWMKTM